MHPASRPCLPALLSTIALWLAVPVPSTAAQSPGCTASIDGVPVEEHADPEDPLELDADAVVAVVATTGQGTDFLKVSLEVPFSSIPLVDAAVEPGSTSVEREVDIADVSDLGVGLYQVTAEVEGCRASMWIEIDEPPLSRPVGAISAAVGLAGLGLVVASLVRARRGASGLAMALLGGALAGLGALGFAQQAGWTGLTDQVLVSWVGVPSLVAGGLRQVTASLVAPSPPPAAPPPPPTAAPPPPPAAAPPPPTTAAPPPPATAAPPPPPPAAAPPPPSADGAGSGGAPVGAGDGAGAEDPPRSSYGLLETPEVVVVGAPFDLEVGLSPSPVAGVVGPPLVRPASSIGDYTLGVQIVADGFTLHGRGTWRKRLKVTAADPYPTTTIRVVPDAGSGDVFARSIQALFSTGGQTMGMVVRSVAVVAREGLDHTAAASPAVESAAISVPTDAHAPDLTVRILRSAGTSTGRLLWTFETPHDIELPDEEIVTDVGDEPEAFAHQLVAGMAAKRGQAGLDQFLRGVGVTVADQMPDELFDLLGAVAARTDRAPSVLLLSEEPFIPWELAVLPHPIDEDELEHLGAQVDVGRWVLGPRRPSLPPPFAARIKHVVVVSGVYDQAAWRLVEAEQEATQLTDDYGAVAVDARADQVFECLAGRPPADLLHFAVHGVYQPADLLEGLILVDGSTLDPVSVRGTELTSGPFVFLNACQVGNGNRVLGDYAGMAEAFLHAGASAVIAPLWSIDDAAARVLALHFYDRTLRHGDRPARVLRDERRRLTDSGRDASATCLAYQYFGHPRMRLTRP